MKIALTSVHVNDPVAAFKFYTEVLGFIERLYMPEALLAIVASPEDPSGTGLLLEPSDHPLAKAYMTGLYKEGMPVIVFGVDDIYAEYERLKARGVVFKQEPTKSQVGIEAVLDDTCGNFVQLFQLT
jgi:predicted enzyme related to lactoylglutathione lyase